MLETSEEICEALVRHAEMSGSECFEKIFIGPKGRRQCAVYCVIGDNADAFITMVQSWLKKNGFKED